MRVLHLSTSAVGGAAIAGQRIHLAMRQAGIDSLFASRGPSVGFDSELVVPLRSSARWRSSLVTAIDRAATGHAASFFSPVSGQFITSEWIQALTPDVIIVHNWFNLLGTSQDGFLKDLGLPTVLVLHDERLFTGGCHYSVGCTGFQHRCEHCPQAQPWARPLTTREHEMMRSRLPDQVAVVAPSRWMQTQAQSSVLLCDRPVLHIPNTIDPRVFSPHTRVTARASFGIANEDLVLAWQPGKGDELLLPILDQVRAQCRGQRVRLLHSGALRENVVDAIGAGVLSNELSRARFWAAADVAFSLTAFDNFPNVVLEAIASGVPFVIPNVGGAGEAIERTGAGLVVERSVDSIASALGALLLDPARHAVASAAGVHGIANFFSPDLVVAGYQRALNDLGVS